MRADERIRNVSIASIPDAVLVVARDRHVAAANSVAQRLFGREDGALVGVRVDELIPHRYRDALHELVDRLVDSASQARPEKPGRELFVLTRDGREVPVEISAGPLGDDEHFVAVVRDVSESAAVKAELQRSEHRFRVAANVAADVIYDADVANDLQGWVGDIDRLTGYRPGEFPRTISGAVETVHPDDREALQATIEQAIETGSGFVTEYRVLRPDGSYTYIKESARMVETVNGRVSRAIGVLTDVTEQVLAEQKLERTVAELTALKDRLQAESHYLQGEIKGHHDFEEIIGSSAALAATLRKVEMVAPTDSTVLLLGETGTGKELLARAIHARSGRRHRPLIKVDCSTLPEGLIESELFGHVKGAYTGAHETKAGRFELAHQGTIFLDEIGELPTDLQSKLLRVLENGEMQRVGSKDDRIVDVRIIAATNRDLEGEVREGRFRSDLYYRLGVFPIESPPLRDRREDIPAIAAFFVSRSATAVGRSFSRIDQGTMDNLVAYDWPGNVRELRNVIERAVILCSGKTLTVEESLGRAISRVSETPGSFKQDLHAIERTQILQALKVSNWKIKGTGGAAGRLGLKPSTLRSRMQRLEISRPEH
jgi:PAS domain S-box-containing protein